MTDDYRKYFSTTASSPRLQPQHRPARASSGPNKPPRPIDCLLTLWWSPGLLSPLSSLTSERNDLGGSAVTASPGPAVTVTAHYRLQTADAKVSPALPWSLRSKYYSTKLCTLLARALSTLTLIDIKVPPTPPAPAS